MDRVRDRRLTEATVLGVMLVEKKVVWALCAELKMPGEPLCSVLKKSETALVSKLRLVD